MTLQHKEFTEYSEMGYSHLRCLKGE